MANVSDTLKACMEINGALGVALVDYNSGMTLGTAGGGVDLDLEIAAAGNTEVVRAKQETMKKLGIAGRIEDILITLDKQYHLIRLLGAGAGDGLFLYLALGKSSANLAMARRQLQAAETKLAI